MNRTTAKQLAASIALVMLILALGCSFEIPVRLMSWGKMYVTKEGAESGQRRNDSFTNLDWTASTNTPVIAVRMPDGRFLRTDEIQQKSFTPYVDSGAASLGGGWDVTVNYAHGEVRVSLGSDGKLERMQLWHRGNGDGTPQASPAFRSSGSTDVLTFPVSERKLKEAFGPPTEDKTVMHNT